MTCPCGHPLHAPGHCAGAMRACGCELAGVLAVAPLDPAFAARITGIPEGDAHRQPTTRRRARRGDPHTSHMAAETYTVSQLRRTQYEIYRLFSLFGPCHDEQLLVRAKEQGVLQSESGIRTRRHELVDAGLLKDSGRCVVLESGKESIVWAVNR